MSLRADMDKVIDDFHKASKAFDEALSNLIDTLDIHFHGNIPPAKPTPERISMAALEKEIGKEINKKVASASSGSGLKLF